MDVALLLTVQRASLIQPAVRLRVEPGPVALLRAWGQVLRDSAIILLLTALVFLASMHFQSGFV